MPVTIASNFQTEINGQARIFPVFELTVAGTVYKFAEEAVASTSEGLYKPFVTGMTNFSRNANTNNFSLEIPNPTVTIYDKERVLQKLIGGPVKGKLKGSVVQCYFRTNATAAGDHFRFFNGVIQNYKLVGNRMWSFTLAPNTLPLNSQPKIPFLTKVDFPTAPDEVIGQPLWIVYGKLASAGIAGVTGMVAALPAVVDTSGDSIDWILGYGQMTIQKLYRTISNVITEDTSNWGFYTVERGLHRYQMARYTGGGTNPVPTDDVRVDCQGLFADSPTSAVTAPFENPAACMRNFLGHFVYGDGDVRAGIDWTDESTVPLNTTIWDAAEDYFSNRNHVMARVIRADEKVINIFNEWCANWNAAPFWTADWEIGAMPEDEAETTIYVDTRHIKQTSNHALSDLRMDTSRSQPVSEININYLLDEAEGTLTQTRIITDPDAIEEVREPFNFEWGDKSLID